MFKLRFLARKIPHYAHRYEYAAGDDFVEMVASVGGRGHLTKADLRRVCKWKAPRSAGNMERNSDAYVEEITLFAFSARDERARIEALTLLDGVSWPTASVILHLCHAEPYPIVDYRALWSVGAAVPALYNFDFWWPYVEFCRALAKRYGVDMRTLDRALWQYSKEYQEKMGTL